MSKPLDIVSIGGGPAGLFFAILTKKTHPDARIRIFERNKPDDTFGWGVVFSDETLGNIEAADPESMEEVRSHFAYWDSIETYLRDTCVVSRGHGFCGLARRQLLLILQERCRALGVEMEFECEIPAAELQDRFPEADLILAADGVNSAIREHHAESFRPSLDWRHCRFAWFGTDKPLEAFTFVFKETEWGLFQVHAYPFEKGLSTWIIECHKDVWTAAGLDQMDEEQSAAFCKKIFAAELGRHELLINRSMWRAFPNIRCERWHHDNIVLIGDSAHTAHFSIGSGTKLAMEDSIALHEALCQHREEGMKAVLEAYHEARYVEVIKTQKAAQTSLEWFENSARYMDQDPTLFQFNLMCRSKRITWDNLQIRDPELVAQTRAAFARQVGAEPDSQGQLPVPAFTPVQLGPLRLHNRIVVSPMCQYSATDGCPDDWHLVHLGSRAVGGAGLLFTEMTNVSAEGRITPSCAGIYSDAHQAAWTRIVDFVHTHSKTPIGLQLAHAGRKGSVSHPWRGDDEPLTDGAWSTLGPSPIPFKPGWPAPREMDAADLTTVREEFVAGARRAAAAGFDVLELHMAHGYLLSTFLSPLSNERSDDYGGSLQNRMRYPLEVFSAVQQAWPDDRPLGVRISATDWLEPEGMTIEDAVVLCQELEKRGCHFVDVSTAGNVPDSPVEWGRMYQVPFAERIKYSLKGMPVIAVGAIQGSDHANTVLAAGRADLCALARPHLADPYLSLHAAERYGFADQYWPGQYEFGKGLSGGA